MPLKSARERRDEARRLIAARIDPSEKSKAERAASSDTFEAIAREYLELKSKSLSARTYIKKPGRFEAFAFPFIGKLPITSIAAGREHRGSCDGACIDQAQATEQCPATDPAKRLFK